MKKVRLQRRSRDYVPQYKGPIEGFVVNYVESNYWRISKLLDREEVFQEAQEIFYRLKQEYPYVDTPQWFMSLYKVSFVRRFNTWSSKDTERRKPESNFEDAFENDESVYQPKLGVDHNQGFLLVLLEEAPDEIRSVINLMMNCPRELFEVFTEIWRAKGKKKDAGNEFLCNMLGKDHSHVDLVSKTKEYFE